MKALFDEGFSNIAKFRKEGTTAFRASFKDEIKKGGHHGIPIDIIPLVELPGSGCYHTPTLGSFKRKIVYLKEWFEPAGEIQFENLILKRPLKHRKVLSEVYETWDSQVEWMTLRCIFVTR